MFSKMQNLFIAVLILIFMPVMVGAETWTDPTCAPPNCNADGPIWSGPSSSQDTYADLDYSTEDNTPVFTITDARTTGATNGSLYIVSSVDSKPALNVSNTGTAIDSYAAKFTASHAPALNISGGIDFVGRGTDPAWATDGLLYYNTTADLFRFYDADNTSWVDLGIQWSVDGDELYHSLSAGTAKGVAIKTGDTTSPNDNYTFEVIRKSQTAGTDKALYAQLIAPGAGTSYTSGTLGGYIDISSTDYPAGVVGKANTSLGIGVYGETGADGYTGAYFATEKRTGYGLIVNKTYSGPLSSATGAIRVDNATPGGYGIQAYTTDNTTASAYGGRFQTSGLDNSAGVYGYADASGAYTTYGGYFKNDAQAGAGVYGYSSNIGVQAYVYKAAGDGRAVQGLADYSGAVTNYGGHFTANGDTGVGVYGAADATGAVKNYGGYFTAAGDSAYGVFGVVAGDTARGVYGMGTGDSGVGVTGYASASGAVFNTGVSGHAAGNTGYGVSGEAIATGVGVANVGGWFKAGGDNGTGVYANGPTTPTATALALKLDNGAMAMEELATLPSATTSYGKFYVKSSDSLPYFLDDSGTEYGLTGGGSGTIADGTADGQMAFWDDTGGTWTYTDTSEIMWDDTNKRLGVGQASPSNKLHVENSASAGIAVYGNATATGATGNYGGYFQAGGDSASGVYGRASGATAKGVSGVNTSSASGAKYGGYFSAGGDGGVGVYGTGNQSGAITNYGGYFIANGASGVGVYAAGPGTPTTTAIALKLDNGAMAMEELATLPTNTSNYGKFYVKSSDSMPYFLDDSGTEYALTGGGAIADGKADGQMVFWNNTGGTWAYTDTASEMYWDDTNKRLGIGISSPQAKLQVAGSYVAIGNDVTGNNHSSNDGQLYVEQGIETDNTSWFGEDVYVGSNSATDDDYLYFDAGVHWLMYDQVGDDRFELNDDLYASTMSSGAYYGSGGSTTYYVDPDNGITSGSFAGNISVGRDSAIDDDFVYFDSNAEYIMWDESEGRFRLSDDVSASSFISPIYYSNNTSYYMDPDSTGSSASLAGSINLYGQLYGRGNLYIDYDFNSTYDYLYFGDSSSVSNYLRFEDANDRFYLNDDLYVLGTVNQSSDRRLKKNIKGIGGALKIVNDLEPVSFDWKDGSSSSYGFIAQDMYEVLPELVHKPIDENSNDDYWGVDYSKMTSILTAAMQEQQVQIEELQENINSDLDNDEVMDYIKSLESRIEDLENKLDMKE